MVVGVVKELIVTLECIRMVVGHSFSIMRGFEIYVFRLCLSLYACVFCVCYACLVCVSECVTFGWFLMVYVMVVIGDRPS